MSPLRKWIVSLRLICQNILCILLFRGYAMPHTKDLNESQKRSVITTEGPVLVVAGPGTGKTLTIVRRIENLIHQGVEPENILAVTFTNRAAREMRERTEALLDKRDSRGIHRYVPPSRPENYEGDIPGWICNL